MAVKSPTFWRCRLWYVRYHTQYFFKGSTIQLNWPELIWNQWNPLRRSAAMTPAGGASIQDQSSRMSSSQSCASVSRCVGGDFRALFSLLVPVDSHQRLSAADRPGPVWPCSAALESCSLCSLTTVSTWERLQLLRLLSRARTRLRARGHSPGRWGYRGMCCGVAQRVLRALILRQLALWWKLPIWEVRGRREIKPGRPTGEKTGETDGGRIWCQGHELLHKNCTMNSFQLGPAASKHSGCTLHSEK